MKRHLVRLALTVAAEAVALAIACVLIEKKYIPAAARFGESKP